MALQKAIELDNGITVNYHRVVSVNNITNQSSIIEVASYTSKTKRLEEKAAIEAGTEMNVFIETERPSIAYNQMLDVDGAYAYLKTLDKFTGYTDDIDE
jgi:adenylylsulfate kinase-like enzyme